MHTVRKIIKAAAIAACAVGAVASVLEGEYMGALLVAALPIVLPARWRRATLRQARQTNAEKKAGIILLCVAGTSLAVALIAAAALILLS